MERTSVEVEAADGRALAVEVAGPPDGDVVLHHVGTPDHHRLFEPLLEAGAVRGLRHVTYSRPGYTGSERHPGRAVADCVADVSAIADRLQIERFYTVGHSGGGPHALACAALAPERVRAAATVAGAAPFDAEGLDWLAGMGDENQREFAALRAGDEELLSFLERSTEHLREVTGEEVLTALGDLLSPPDQEILTGAYAESVAESFRAALRDGVWGWFDDDKAFAASWGFELATIRVPVTVWQGRDDRFVPFAHGEWLASHVAGAEPRLLGGEGHLSLAIGRYGDVLDGLIAAGS